jgi:lysophospholipase L1-like esterase
VESKEVFMAVVKLNPEPQNAIVFAGSSIFYFWTTLVDDMAPLPVINQAFAGARMHSVFNAMDKLIVPYNPKIIVYYCGSNDINDGADASDILSGFEKFVSSVRDKLPSTIVYFISINKAPQKMAKCAVIDDSNEKINKWCKKTDGLYFIDINPHFFICGQSRTDLFFEDGLHFQPEAYVEFTKIIKPVIEKGWRQLNEC